MQFRNEDRAVFGKGPYKLRKGFEKYYVNDFKWGQLTAQQRLTKIKEFRNVCMSRKDKDPKKNIQLLANRIIIYQYHSKILK